MILTGTGSEKRFVLIMVTRESFLQKHCCKEWKWEEMPKISVIVPVYNVEKYLPHCVDSILEQTFFDLEVILVDDGSTDRCGVICDEYAAKDNRVIVIHGVNSGVSAARNKGTDIP